MNMKYTPVNSSSISHIGYNPDTETLHVRFQHGSREYAYPGVPAHEHEALLKAESVGRHFMQHIRPHYNGREL